MNNPAEAMPSPAQAVAVLRGLADDYSRLLAQHGSTTTSGMVAGVGKQAADSLTLYLRSLKAPAPIPPPEPVAVE